MADERRSRTPRRATMLEGGLTPTGPVVEIRVGLTRRMLPLVPPFAWLSSSTDEDPNDESKWDQPFEGSFNYQRVVVLARCPDDYGDGAGKTDPSQRPPCEALWLHIPDDSHRRMAPIWSGSTSKQGPPSRSAPRTLRTTLHRSDRYNISTGSRAARVYGIWRDSSGKGTRM